jgi:hypothetical protein
VTAFCADLSRAAGEPLPGTGAHPGRMLLLRWPKGGWDRRIFAAPGMAADLAAALAALHEAPAPAGRRVQLIDRKDQASGRHRLFLYPEGLTREVAAADLPAAVAAVRAGDLSGWRVRARPVLLVCTHGIKDRCCAKWGFAAYRALVREAGPDGPEPWESTHLGGCRLSASALVLPALRKYGRLRPEDAAALLADEAHGRPWLPGWRGPSHLPPEAQAVVHAGETWARARGGRITGPPRRRGDAWRLRAALSGGARDLTLRCRSDAVARPSTCADLDAGACGHGMVWTARVIRVDPVADGSG